LEGISKKLYAMGIIYIGSSFIRYESNCECLAMKTVDHRFGKTERAVGWEGNGETTGVKAGEALCLRHSQITDMLLLVRHCLYLRTSTDNGYALTVVVKSFLYLDLVVVHHSHKVIQQVQQVLSKWFAEDGLELKT